MAVTRYQSIFRPNSFFKIGSVFKKLLAVYNTNTFE